MAKIKGTSGKIYIDGKLIGLGELILETPVMTENEWITSTDQQRMWQFVEWRITDRQRRFIWEHPMEGMADTIREIVGNPFRPVVRYPSDVPRTHERPEHYRAVGHIVVLDEWMSWRDGTIPRMARKIAGMCPECRGHGIIPNILADSMFSRCGSCNGTGHIHEPHWDDLPLLADALEEAGCTEVAILDHFRGTEKCPPCKGEGGKMTSDSHGYADYWQSCGYCWGKVTEFVGDGTGNRKTNHVRGCWVLELLLGQ